MVNEVAAASDATWARTWDAAVATYAHDDLLPAASRTDASTVPPPVHDPVAFTGAAAVDDADGVLEPELDDGAPADDDVDDALEDDEELDDGLVLDDADEDDDCDDEDVEAVDEGADVDDADGAPPVVGAAVELIGATVGASETGCDVCPRVTTHAAANATAANAMTRTGASQ